MKRLKNTYIRASKLDIVKCKEHSEKEQKLMDWNFCSIVVTWNIMKMLAAYTEREQLRGCEIVMSTIAT